MQETAAAICPEWRVGTEPLDPAFLATFFITWQGMPPDVKRTRTKNHAGGMVGRTRSVCSDKQRQQAAPVHLKGSPVPSSRASHRDLPSVHGAALVSTMQRLEATWSAQV